MDVSEDFASSADVSVDVGVDADVDTSADVTGDVSESLDDAAATSEQIGVDLTSSTDTAIENGIDEIQGIGE